MELNGFELTNFFKDRFIVSRRQAKLGKIVKGRKSCFQRRFTECLPILRMRSQGMWVAWSELRLDPFSRWCKSAGAFRMRVMPEVRLRSRRYFDYIWRTGLARGRFNLALASIRTVPASMTHAPKKKAPTWCAGAWLFAYRLNYLRLIF